MIDTDAFDRQFCGQQLRERGFTIDLCGSYEEGEQRLAEGDYDLVIVDEGGPAFEGRVIAEHSVLKDRKMPVLVIARHHHMRSYLEAMQLGAVDYMEKPLALDNLIWAIETHLPSNYSGQ